MRHTVIMMAMMVFCAWSASASASELGDSASDRATYALTPEMEETARSRVGEKLRDEESARYYNLRGMGKEADGSVVCGEVNAKNAYGAYVGRRKFAVMPSRVIIWSDGSDWDAQDSRKWIQMICGS
ncbi:hypothetical protein S7S_01530 [Isoalcanivorax pacificus W11-5]|uniref:Secreted protein n=1 Tax=Isoalcanivorax pacificus W11-5 TaxID=391936 RepID=A0A0B4XJ52_9GAMM|nr:hypothetical protein [Isoalcanivorax pacificus]AJD46730.1 hypothetical protein S7S_01530 [Isoalcanivorax pacificus W11-5]